MQFPAWPRGQAHHEVRSAPLLARAQAKKRTRRGQKSGFAHVTRAPVDGGQEIASVRRPTQCWARQLHE